MLARIARTVPAIAIEASSAGEMLAMPLSSATLTFAGLAIDRLPFGPLTEMASAVTESSTPFGIGIGFLATRDIVRLPLGNQADDFATHAFGAGSAVSHDALRGGNDRDAQTTEDPGQRVLAAVLPEARARHALQPLDDRLAEV